MPGLCIVSRDYPMLFGYLVLVYGRQGAEDVDVIIDRRHGAGRDSASARLDRRAHPEIEEALRAQGYAVVGAGRKRGRRPIELAEPPDVPARGAQAAGTDDDDRDPPIRASRVRIAVATLGGIVLGLFIIMVASEDVVGGAARATVAVIEWVRGDGAAKTASAPKATPPAAPAVKSPDRDARTAPLPAMDTRPPEPTAAVPSPTLPPPTAPRTAPPAPAASAPPPATAVTPPASASAAVTPAPASKAPPRSAEEPEPAPAQRASAPSWSGLPKVELSAQAAGSGTKRTLAYTVKLSDTEGRPLSGADVWLRVALPDRPEQETRLTPADPPGTYRGRLTVGTRTPQVSRVRIGIGGTRVEVPVGQPR